MRQLNAAYEALNLTPSAVPRIVVRLEPPSGVPATPMIFTTGKVDGLLPAAGLIYSGAIKSVKVSSQRIEPERGISEIGQTKLLINGRSYYKNNTPLGILDRMLRMNFLSDLIDLDVQNLSINNWKQTVLLGFVGLDFANYVPMPPMTVYQVSNGEAGDWEISARDVQRFARSAIFTGGPESELDMIVSETQELTYLQLRDVTNFALINVDAAESNYPAAMGVVEVEGDDDEIEYIIFTGVDTINNRLTGITRGAFNSDRVELSGTGQSRSNVKQIPFTAQRPLSMIYGLMTGYFLPESGANPPQAPDWMHAGVDTGLIDLNSFVNADADLLAADKRDVLGLSEEDCRLFINRELLMPLNCQLIINDQGRFELKRWHSVPALVDGGLEINDYDLIELTPIVRSADSIKNNFAFKWDYDRTRDFFRRTTNFVNLDSQQRNNFKSAPYVLKFKTMSNRIRDNSDQIYRMADGVRARMSDYVIKQRATVTMRLAAQLEVGDLVTIKSSRLKDFRQKTDPNDADYIQTLEVRQIEFNPMDRRATLELQGGYGTPGEVSYGSGRNIATTFDDSGWPLLTTALTAAGITYTSIGSTLTITGVGTLAGGQYTAGNTTDVIWGAGSNVAITGTPVINARSVHHASTSSIDGVANSGHAGLPRFFGGADAAQMGIRGRLTGLFGNRDFKAVSVTRYTNTGTLTPPDMQIKVDDNNQLIGLPLSLEGNGGSAGKSSTAQSSQIDPGVPEHFAAGGSARSGGAGLCYLVESLTWDIGASIDLSGQASENGARKQTDSGIWMAGGSSGFGWPGFFLVVQKNNDALIDPVGGSDRLLTSKCGAFTEVQTGTNRVTVDGNWIRAGAGNWNPPLPNSYSSAGKELNAWRTVRLVSEAPPVADVATTKPLPPASIAVTQEADTPKSTDQRWVTLQVDIVPAADPLAIGTTIEYRQGVKSWIPVSRRTGNTALIVVEQGTGDWEISARSYSGAGVYSEARTTTTVTVLANQVEVDDGGQAPTMPPIRGFKLLTAVDNINNWNKFKGRDIEFTWNRLATNPNGSLLNLQGSTDLYLEGYEVSIYTPNGGALLHSETVTQNHFKLIFDSNRKLAGGPHRALQIGITAYGKNGGVSQQYRAQIENPATLAPSGLEITTTDKTASVSFAQPSDTDFVGFQYGIGLTSTEAYARLGGKIIGGNQVNIGDLLANTNYVIAVRMIDSFGAGGETHASFKTAKVLDGQIDVDINVGTGVLIDGANGRIVTTNNDGTGNPYNVLMGSHYVGGPELLISANNGLTTIFSVDVNGVTSVGYGQGKIVLDNGSIVFGDGAQSITYDNNQLTIGQAGQSITAVGGQLIFGSADQAITIDNTGKTILGNGIEIGRNDPITVTAGSPAADFLTPQAALEHLSKTYVPALNTSGILITVQLVAGFEFTSQILLEGGDFGHIEITSVDPVVSVRKSAFTQTRSSAGSAAYRPLVYCRNGVAPKIAFASQYVDTYVAGTDWSHTLLMLDDAHGMITADADQWPNYILAFNGSVADVGSLPLCTNLRKFAIRCEASRVDANITFTRDPAYSATADSAAAVFVSDGRVVMRSTDGMVTASYGGIISSATGVMSGPVTIERGGTMGGFSIDFDGDFVNKGTLYGSSHSFANAVINYGVIEGDNLAFNAAFDNYGRFDGRGAIASTTVRTFEGGVTIMDGNGTGTINGNCEVYGGYVELIDVDLINTTSIISVQQFGRVYFNNQCTVNDGLGTQIAITAGYTNLAALDTLDYKGIIGNHATK